MGIYYGIWPRGCTAGGGWGGDEEWQRWGWHGRIHIPSATESSDVRRDGNISYLVSITPPGVGTTVYWGVTRR